MMQQIKVFHLPGMRLNTTSNTGGHWRTKAVEANRQRSVAFASIRAWIHLAPKFPCRVTIVRIGKRKMDDDNLASSAKHVRDGVADAYGVDDGDERWEWRYRQESWKGGEYGSWKAGPVYGVRIEIEEVSP